MQCHDQVRRVSVLEIKYPLCPSQPEPIVFLADIPFPCLGTPHCAGLAQVAFHCWQPIRATPFTRPLRASSQLGWVLYKREPSDWDLREPQAGCPTPQGRLRGTSCGYSTHEHSFLSHLSSILHVSTGAFQPPIAKPQCV